MQLAADQFDLPPGYLNTASIGVPPRDALEALRQATADWGAGRVQPPEYDPYVDTARASFARLVGVEARDVAVGTQVSTFTSMVAASLAPGDEVLVFADDFSSVLFPLLVVRERGVRVRTVATLGELAGAIDASTALVAVSAVQSADGAVADLDAIAAAAAAHGARTYVDATQAVGWLPLDASRFDFVAVAAYKWLLAPRGAAFMTARREGLEEVPPIAAGWYAGEDRWGSLYGQELPLATDARRLDVSPAWLSWVAAAPSLALLEQVGVEAIHAHDVALANRFRSGVGMERSNSAIVATSIAGAAERLDAAGVKAAARAGAFRLSFHLYNSEADVDLALDALA
jgi:selenocysteine lyase/cysteine desulfurase